MIKKTVDFSEIESFLAGRDEQKYITNIEAPYDGNYAYLIINDPETGKRIEKHTYKPFLWFNDEVTQHLCGGNRTEIRKQMEKYGISIKKLRDTRDDGISHERLEESFKYKATIKTGTYNQLLNFFKYNGVNIFTKEHRKNFVTIAPHEQFLISTGKRLFKGFEYYDDIHRVQFDLETTGLEGKKDRIFQIGIRDNRGFEAVLEVTGSTHAELRESEKEVITEMFAIIDALKPDVITAFNSENFDWRFIEDRCSYLFLPLHSIVKTLDGLSTYKTNNRAILKLGGESEPYTQTTMWGFTILDISHAVRKAKAINSSIKKWNLKYITKFSKINKPNRVYVPGNEIHTTWADTDFQYGFNDTNGEYFKYDVSKPKAVEKFATGDYVLKTGAYIVQRYLKDDLWETEKVDTIFNEAEFLVSKILPTSFTRSATMGTAGKWNLIMLAWSFEKNLAIPKLGDKEKFTGGLARLLQVGFAKNVAKLDYAALYPNIQITHDIFPEFDMSGVMGGLLLYIASTRDKYKFLKNDNGELADEVKEKIDVAKENGEDYSLLEIEYEKYSKLKSDYDKKQLPLKILANSFFGSFGAPYIFYWGDIDKAEEITCRGRQYLRLLVKHFYEKYNFEPLVGDSVTFDTPIFIRWKNTREIDILPISDIFNEDSEVFDEEKLRDLEIKPYEVLTVNGWKEIDYVYRHKTDKKIHRVSTKDKLVCVTEDHSLFKNGKEIKPKELKRGDVLDVRNIENFDKGSIEYLDEELAYLYGYFLGDGSAFYGDRKQYYKSKKTGETHINKGKRSVFKISSSNREKLVKLQLILEEQFDVKSKIKDHLKSSGVYNLISYSKIPSMKFSKEFYTSYREKKVPYYILNANNKIKLSFLEGVFSSDGYGDTLEECSDIGMKSQVAMSGIGYLMDCLGVDKKLKTRKDKENFISFKLKNRNRGNSTFTDKTQMKTNEVWLNEVIENRCTNKYVYDISTQDGTFVGGIGGVDLKNTDGFNFAIPETVNSISYLVKGSHRLTEKNKGKTLVGLKAVVADFNEEYMIGRMGLDIDEICESTINFARKNYGNLIGGKVKLVGASIKSDKIPIYIEEFIDKGLTLLLDDKGKDFLELYYDTVEKIYNYQIPLIKIASKSRVKLGAEEYLTHVGKKNKAGNSLPRQAHMELALNAGIKLEKGQTLYYINTGEAKSHGDIKTSKDENGNVNIQFNSELLSSELLESEDTFSDRLNVARYIDAFNKKVEPLLVCFHPDIRDRVEIATRSTKNVKKGEPKTVNNILINLVNVKVDDENNPKKSKTIKVLEDRKYFTREQCKLVSGYPFSPEKQDDYVENLMKMSDSEVTFWLRTNKMPNNMTEEEWFDTQKTYHKEQAEKKIEAIQLESKFVDTLLRELEVSQYNDIMEGNIPIQLQNLLTFATVDGDYTVTSIANGNLYGKQEFLMKYYGDAKERQEFYKTLSSDVKDKYQEWLAFKYQTVTN